MPDRTKDFRDLSTRADAITRDIYNRHQIPDGLPVPQAAIHLLDKAEQSGSGYGNAWSSPEERDAARTSYAQSHPDPNGPKHKSQYLMSPGDAQHHAAYGRDITFLSNLAEQGPRQAVGRWDRNHAPLHRSGIFEPNTYQNSGGTGAIGSPAFVQGVNEAVEVNETQPFTHAMRSLDSIPKAIQIYRMGDGRKASEGPVDFLSGLVDAFNQAEGYRNLTATTLRHSADSRSPVNVPGYSGEAGRMAADKAMPVPVAQSVAEHNNGWTYPNWLTDLAEVAENIPDQTLFLTGVVKGAGGAAKSAVLKDMAKDSAYDAGTNLALNASAGAYSQENPERTWYNYFLPHKYAGNIRTPEERQQAADIRREWSLRRGR